VATVPQDCQSRLHNPVRILACPVSTQRLTVDCVLQIVWSPIAQPTAEGTAVGVTQRVFVRVFGTSRELRLEQLSQLRTNSIEAASGDEVGCGWPNRDVFETPAIARLAGSNRSTFRSETSTRRGLGSMQRGGRRSPITANFWPGEDHLFTHLARFFRLSTVPGSVG